MILLTIEMSRLGHDLGKEHLFLVVHSLQEILCVLFLARITFPVSLASALTLFLLSLVVDGIGLGIFVLNTWVVVLVALLIHVSVLGVFGVVDSLFLLLLLLLLFLLSASPILALSM